MTIRPFDPLFLDPATVTQRRTRIATIVLALTLPAALAIADLHWKTGFDGWKLLHLGLFTILFAQLAFGVAQAFTGYLLRRKGGDPLRIVCTLDPADRSPLMARTAVIMPICNEEVRRVMAGMRAIFNSVESTHQLGNCDFFFLSDSRDPNQWIEEEAAWLALVKETGAQGRMFYRKRRVGINKKAGNVADFCRRWGHRYDYMVVLDADSIISGEAVVQLVRMMERNPKVGLIQAVPMLVNGDTIFARVQQFASRLYGSIFSAGLNYWQLGEGNYWGHNAIVRVGPFIRHCSLPDLSGDGPFGGRIMSHDYVEAALMRRAGWQVWLATDLAGNYEECPANLIDFAKRDRRWLQGNLQHASLIFARGFHAVNRLHFFLGILSYLASPLWFVLILVSCVIGYRAGAGPENAARAAPTAQAAVVFAVTLALLLVPKMLALLDVRYRVGEVERFGGWRKVTGSMVGETVIFTLVAPVLMLFHTKFVILTMLRRTISWGSQRRRADADWAWAEAASAHMGHTAIGIVLALAVGRFTPALLPWMSPLIVGLLLSIPVSVATGSPRLGAWVRAKGWFATPEETSPGEELKSLNNVLSTAGSRAQPDPRLVEHYGMLQAILDPFVNAAHVSLLRAKDNALQAEARLAELREKLVREGPQALTATEHLALVSDLDSMVVLHEAVWAAPPEKLAPWWRLALAHYSSVSVRPTTAFTSTG